MKRNARIWRVSRRERRDLSDADVNAQRLSAKGISMFLRIASLVMFALLVPLGFSMAGQYPSGTVTIIVPFSAGGTVDLMGRIAAKALTQELKGNFIVENRTGAGGVIGGAYVSRAPADGSTLLLAPTAFAITPYTYKNMAYDPRKDFEPISLLGYTGNVMVVSPSLNVNTVQEFIALAKSKPITYASPGVGTPQHLYVEYFASKTGLKMQHVAYAGSSPALVGLMSGDVTMMFSDLAPAIPLIKSGKLKALGVLTPQRSPDLPDTPTVAETVPGFTAVGWQAVLARSGTPPDIVRSLNQGLVTYLKRPEAAAEMRAIGVETKWSSPEETRAWIDAQLTQFGEIIPAAGIKPE
jgi:tripartite-type tricarboxylate transporter receptor subunit TctC